MTDLLSVFAELDAARTGAVPLADFEAAMLRAGVPPEAAARLFAAVDADGDGVLTFADWSSECVRRVAQALTYRLIRQRLVGNNPVKAQRPPSSVRCPPAAAAALLGPAFSNGGCPRPGCGGPGVPCACGVRSEVLRTAHSCRAISFAAHRIVCGGLRESCVPRV